MKATTVFHAILLGAAVAATSIAAPASANPEAAVKSGSCAPAKFKYKTSSVSVNSTTQTLVVMPDTKLKFTQGGNKPSCVIVRFSGLASVAYPNFLRIRARIDGGKIAEPGEVQFDGYTELSVARAIDFVFPAIAPGDHVLRIDWRGFTGGQFYMNRHSTIVQYR